MDVAAAGKVRAEEEHHRGLPRLAHGGQRALGDARGGRLGDDDDHSRRRIAREELESREERGAADLVVDVAAAGADRVRHAFAELVDADGHFLHAGARRADDADRAAPHGVRESERHAGDDRGAAVGPHDEEPLLRRQALHRLLLGERDVVAEEEDVQAALQRLQRFGGRVRARHGHLRERRALEPLLAHRDRARRDLDRAGGRLGVAAGERRLDRLERRRECARLAFDEDHEVGGRRARELRDEQARLAEDVLVRGRAHQERHAREARAARDRLRNAHQGDRVLVEVLPRGRGDRHGRCGGRCGRG